SAGAAGATLDETVRVLHLPADQAAVHAGFAALTKALADAAAQSRYEWHLANALWTQRGFPFRPDFLDLMKRYYDAGLQTADFAGDREAAGQTINRWAQAQTRDRIKDLFPPNVLNNLTRLVLANAVYFKGAWARPFPKAVTADEPFHPAGGPA